MREKNNKDTEAFELEKMATKKVVKLKAFYSHMFVYVIGVIFFYFEGIFRSSV